MSAQLNCFFTQSCTSILRLVLHHAGFRNEDAENESVPYPEVQEKAPDSNSDGRALEAEPDGLEVKGLR